MRAAGGNVGGVAALPLDRFAPFPDRWLVRFDTVFQRCFVTVVINVFG